MRNEKKQNQVEIATENKWLCNGCVGDSYLKDQLRQAGTGVCSYCGRRRKGAPIREVADEFEGAFERHFVRTSTEPNDYEYMLLKYPESSYYFERHGEPILDVIQEIGEVSEPIASDILEVLQERHSDYEAYKMGEECDFDSDSYYTNRRTSIAELHSQWLEFQTSLRTQTRYFNTTAELFLDDIFRDMGEEQPGVIVGAGPKASLSALFRARVFQDGESLQGALARPDRELGPPPLNSRRLAA